MSSPNTLAHFDSLLFDGGPPPSLEDVARSIVGDADGQDAVELLLAADGSAERRQARAAALVHALNRNPDLFEGRGLKVRKNALRFIEDAFAAQGRAWGLTNNGEDFERLRAVAALPTAASEQIEQAAAQLVSLSSLESARGEIQRAFNTYRALLVPMIPAPLVKSKLTDLMTAVAEVRESEGPAFLAAHARACEAVADFRRDVEDAGAIAFRSFSELLTRAETLLQTAYDANPATAPAEVDARPASKKYALSTDSAPLRLGVSIVNHGPGQALDVRLEELAADGMALASETVPLGTIMPGERISGTIVGTSVGEPSALVTGQVRWSDSDGSSREAPFELIFESQRSDIPWDELRQRYDLEPVRTRQDLVGRAELLRELVDLVAERSVGSAFVTGQKRVGKTSIALTFQTHFETDEELLVVYLDAGEYIRPAAEDTIVAMGAAIASELAAADERFSDIAVPEFGSTLAPLRAMVGQMRKRVPRLRVMVVLDEFDELPLALYRRGDIADAFFVALRTLAGQQHIGFVLVGGEKMGPVIDAQGDQLNKFESIPVTYLDRERHWDDFSDLVRRPVADCFEVTDEAVVALYDFTSGHPYFTKLICRALFKLAVSRRDAHITAQEIYEATDDALRSASVTNFIHFWEDGVLESAEKVEDVSVRRRKVLLAYAECQEREDREVESVITRAAAFGLGEHEARETIREFERRGVLVTSAGAVRAKVRLFDVWLARYGVNAITTTFTDPDAVLSARRREQEQRVSAEEITEIVAHWGHYRGREVTADHVRQWLNQFEGIREQRLMYGVLEAVNFYDAGRIREKLAEAHGVAVRGVTQRYETGRLKRGEFVVSYMGGPAKSGARYARLYADQNGIYADHVKDLGRLPNALGEEACQALVIVDDLLGSGDQACEFLETLDVQVGGLIRKRAIKVVFVAVTGFDTAARRVTTATERLELPAEIHVCDPLGESDRCFSDESRAFPAEADRLSAREVAESYGRRLQRKSPLGYGGIQATIVFDESCPNGTLPILWDTTGNWHALFPRHKGR